MKTDTENIESLQKKQNWAESAAQYYLTCNIFTLKGLAEYLEEDVQEIYQHFAEADDLLKFYYELQVLKYRHMVLEIDDFEKLSLAEKLSNFAYTMFDLFSEDREFVTATFEDYILNSYYKTNFQEEVEDLFKEYIEADPRVSTSSQFITWPLFYGFLANEYLHLIHFWMDDSSPNYEKTMAFTDKLTSFLEEMMYSKILDKGFDLGRFLASNGAISHRYPLISYLIPTWLFESNK